MALLSRWLVSRRIRSRDEVVRAQALARLLSLARRSPRNAAWAGKVGLRLLSEVRTAQAGVEIFRSIRPPGFSQALFESWLAHLYRTDGDYQTKLHEAALHAVVAPTELGSMLDALAKGRQSQVLKGSLRPFVASCVRNFPAESLDAIAALVRERRDAGYALELKRGIVEGFLEEGLRKDDFTFTLEERHLACILEGVDRNGPEGGFFADLLGDIESSTGKLDHPRLQALVPRFLDKLRRLPRDAIGGRLTSSILGVLLMLKAEDAVLKACRAHPDDGLWLAAANSVAARRHGGVALLRGLHERIRAGGPDASRAVDLLRAMVGMVGNASLRPRAEEVADLLKEAAPERLLGAQPLAPLDLATLALRIAVGDSLEQACTSLLRHSGEQHVRELMVLMLRRHAGSVTDEHLRQFHDLRDRDSRQYKVVDYGEGAWREHLTGGELYDFQEVRSLAGGERERRRSSGHGRPFA